MGKAGGNMKWRIWVLLGMLVLLIFTVVWQQVYTDSTMQVMMEKSQTLSDTLMEEDGVTALAQAQEIVDFWDSREVIISLFVDYRDIEQIGRQTQYVLSYIESGDFELARVECEQLNHVADIFYNIVRLDWQNIL